MQVAYDIMEIPKDFDPVKVYKDINNAIYGTFVSIDEQADFPKYTLQYW